MVPDKDLIHFDGKIKRFSDKQKLREFSTTKPALQQMLNGLIKSRNTREEKKIYKINPKQLRKWQYMYISIITWNVNGLNVSTKRRRLVECIHKQDPYMCYLQETHSRPKDTYRLKEDGKSYSMQMGNKRKLE